jgi:hypothetical protein
MAKLTAVGKRGRVSNGKSAPTVPWEGREDAEATPKNTIPVNWYFPQVETQAPACQNLSCTPKLKASGEPPEFYRRADVPFDPGPSALSEGAGVEDGSLCCQNEPSSGPQDGDPPRSATTDARRSRPRDATTPLSGVVASLPRPVETASRASKLTSSCIRPSRKN